MKFRFAITSDLHIALPHTVYDHPRRFHLVEYSIPAFEAVLGHLAELDIDFLLLPGDLTQHGEPENHRWLSDRLSQLPYPVYVIPGNHDVPSVPSLEQFVSFYPAYGYSQTTELYYAVQLLPEVRLIGMNSNLFDAEERQIGAVDERQLTWLEQTLRQGDYAVNLLMIHHNVLSHVPNQSKIPIGRRYILENAEELCQILHQYSVHFVFTGHLHVQDIAYSDRYDLYDITTGSLVSYPHPYRLVEFSGDRTKQELSITSYRVTRIPEQADLLHFSREWMGDRSAPFLLNLLAHPPLSLTTLEAEPLLPELRYFWADIANGDAQFSFPHFPPSARQFLEGFSDPPPRDNHTKLVVHQQFKLG